MIAKKNRFHGYSALRFVYAKGKTVRSRRVSLRYGRNMRRSESRVAIVVSKKVTKKAPERNRIRRRLYEAVRLRWSMIEPGYDLVITAFDQQLATVPAEKIQSLVDNLLEQAGLFKQ